MGCRGSVSKPLIAMLLLLLSYRLAQPIDSLRLKPRNDMGCRGSVSKPLMAMLLLLFFTACRSHRWSTETLVVAQRQQCQLAVSDSLWQQLTVCFEDLVVEWLSDSTSTDIGPKTTVRLTATKAEFGSEQQEARTLIAAVQHSDTLSQQQVMESATGIAAPDPIEGARHRWWWLWLLLIALLAIGVVIVRWRMKW